PTLSRSTVRHVELVALAPSRVLVVLILSTGRVEQRLVELDHEIGDDDLATIRSAVHRAAIGETIADALTALRTLEQVDPATASWGRPAWTTRGRWWLCAPSPATSRASSTRREDRRKTLEQRPL